MKKRILAILLTFIIAAGIVPLSVPASDDLDLITRAQLAEIIYSDPNLKELIDSVPQLTESRIRVPTPNARLLQRLPRQA